MPPSRENAKIMREAEVTVAKPHRYCATKTTTYRNNFTPLGNTASDVQKNTFQPCFAPSSMFGIASVNPIRNSQPNNPDQITEPTMPFGTERDASTVSSEVWAEAS